MFNKVLVIFSQGHKNLVGQLPQAQLDPVGDVLTRGGQEVVVDVGPAVQDGHGRLLHHSKVYRI